MKGKVFFSAVLLAWSCITWGGGGTDLLFPPTSSSGHDFNHAPIGQTFRALAPRVRAGIYIADGDSFTRWLQETYSYLPPYPYAIAQHLTIKVQLLQGGGVDGGVLDEETRELIPPFMGFLAVDYAAKGVLLETGNDYTLLLTDMSNQSYPNGVTGWVVPALAPGSYGEGQPILQGVLVTNEQVGDNSFEVLDTRGITPLSVSGTLPNGQVGEPYSANLAASGGEPPYTWFVTGLPAGLVFDGVDAISGVPTVEGGFTVGVTAVDSAGTTAAASYDMVISAASEPSCTKPAGARSSRGKGTVQEVGDGYILAGRKSTHVDYASCTELNFGGSATAPVVGDRVEWEGFIQANGDVMAQVLTFN